MLLFIKDEATVVFGTPLVRIYAFLPFTMGYNNNTRTLLQALGRKKVSSTFSLIRQVLLYVPLALLLDRLARLHCFKIINQRIPDLDRFFFRCGLGIGICIQ